MLARPSHTIDPQEECVHLCVRAYMYAKTERQNQCPVSSSSKQIDRSRDLPVVVVVVPSAEGLRVTIN